MTFFRSTRILHNYFEQMIMCLLLKELSKWHYYLAVSKFTESCMRSKNTTNMAWEQWHFVHIYIKFLSALMPELECFEFQWPLEKFYISLSYFLYH